MNGNFIDGKNEKKIWLYTWNKVENPIGVIQIFHGMAEHAARYTEFAEFLNLKGYIVYADDHRGHGKTADEIDSLGDIGNDGFNMIVEDEYIITKIIKEEYPELPVIVLGHSFGSFIAQEFLIRYGSEIDGIILIGSAAKKGLEVVSGKQIAMIQRKLKGEKTKSNLIDKLSFGGYNKRVKYPKNKFEWLNRDIKEVEKYIEDPYCGTIFPIIFYTNLLNGLNRLYKKERLEFIPKDIPVLILSGQEDPVGKYGKAVRSLQRIYLAIGIKNVKLKLYEGCRHEILLEINRNEIFDDIDKWVNKVIER